VNAGISEYAPLEDISEDHFDRTFGLNVKSLAFCGAGCDRHDADGRNDCVDRLDCGRHRHQRLWRVRCDQSCSPFVYTNLGERTCSQRHPNVVSPGPTDTAMMAAASQEVRDALSNMIPLGRMGRPEEVAAAALFLASEESSFPTGSEIAVDGGMAQI